MNIYYTMGIKQYFSIIVLTLLFLFNDNSLLFSQAKTDSKNQHIGAISGKLIDKNTSQPVEYANVILFKMPDSVIVGGCVSVDNGAFKLEKLAYGKYSLKIQFIGYTPVVKSEIIVTENKPKIWIGNIEMVSKSDNIDEVTVTAKKNIVETKLDKKVINVDQAIVSTGGSAVDVLKNVPSVSVDAEGNLSLRGSDNVTVLMDGRPSTYTSLDQVPASIIDRVEIVTNPSAKFDASGMVGIVNIITKHKSGQGLNGQVSFNYGTWDKYNGNATINYGTSKANFYLIIDGRQNNSKVYNNQFIETDTQKTYIVDTTNRTMQMGSIKFGVDYSINDKNLLSLSLFDRQFYSDGDQNAHNRNIKNNTLLRSFATSTNTTIRSGAFVPNIQYRRLFDKKDETLIFTIDGDYDYPGKTTTEFLKLDTLKNGLNKAVPNYFYTFSVDYSLPIKENSKFECGMKFNNVYSEYRNLQTKMVDNTTLPYLFVQSGDVTHQELDGYVQYGSQFKKIQYQVGLRMQQNNIGYKDFQTNSKKEKNYINPFPSFALSYKKNEDNVFQLNYSKRVNYPDARLFNPNLIQIDATNWTKGNALLIPELVNSFELGYSLNLKKISMTNTLFYRVVKNTLTRTQESGVNNSNDPIFISSMENGKMYQVFGFEHFDNFTITNWLKHSLNVTINIAELTDTILKQHYSSPNGSWLMKYSLTATPLKSIELTASYNYNSSMISMQGGSGRFSSGPSAGLVGENWQSDVSLRKILWKGKASISLRLTDIFKSSKYNIDYYSSDYHSTILKTRNSRILYVGCMYKINGGLKQKKKPVEVQDADF